MLRPDINVNYTFCQLFSPVVRNLANRIYNPLDINSYSQQLANQIQIV